MTTFTRPNARPDAEVRLLVFHHAGGSAAGYFPLARLLPRTWDPVLYDLPGHGRRRFENPLDTVAGMAARAVDDLRDELDAPFALFGHSLGALVAFETARALTARGRAPLWLGVSGRGAPGHRINRTGGLHRFGDTALLHALDAVGGGLPPRLADVPDFRDRFLRLVRADLGAVDAYRPDPDRLPLTCPVSAYTGADDPWVPLEGVTAWEAETVAGFTHSVLPGGHFPFIEHGPGRLARAIATDLRAAAPVSAVTV